MMRKRGLELIAVIAFATWTVLASAQEASLRVVDAEGRSNTLTWAAIRALPAAQIKATSEKGEPQAYTCATVFDALASGLVTPREPLKGKAMQDALVVSASDGYAVLFALPELDPAFTDPKVYLCYKQEGEPLPASEGPFRLVVMGEKKHARWIRNIVELKIIKGVRGP